MPRNTGTYERERFHSVLRQARKRSGRTIQDLAFHVNVSERTYGYWEQGRTLPTLPQVRVLVAALDDPRFTDQIRRLLGLNAWYAQVAV